MKRNNLYFLSYTLFIFICFAVKCVWDYPLWGVIVAAITTASCIFACADIAELVATEYETDVNNFQPLLKSALDKCNKIDKFFSKHKSILEHQTENNEELVSALLDGPQAIENVKNELLKIQNGLNLKKRLSNFCKNIIGPLVVLGNLLFFCTVAFEPINSMLVPIQDYLTVFAFGVLMLTQYLGSSVREAHVELEENYQEANDLLDDTNETILRAFQTLEKELMFVVEKEE